MQHKKVYYISPFAHGELHLVANSSMLQFCQLSFENVFCYSDEEHYLKLLAINTSLEPKRISQTNLYVPHGNSDYALVLRHITSAFQSIKLFLLLPKDGLFLFNANVVFSIRIINALNAFLKKDIIFCSHGELERTLPERKSGGTKDNIFF